MKIKNISCTQFAGVRDQNVAFTDGINVIYGKNESGKSTLVNLLSRTLFQSAKLDRRSDKKFYELYFPCAKKGSSFAGDFADGIITIETENGTYKLTKEWGDDARCTLSTPDGIIRDQSKIDELLKEVLLYGEGVYSEMLFSSQRNTDISLQTILDASDKNEIKQEITNSVSQAFAESDGIPIDTIEKAIIAKIDEIAGKHWDFERQMPARKTGRWSNGLGEILKAYYTMEDARTALEEISALEREADIAAKTYADKDAAARVSDEEYNRFNTFASHLAVQNERKKAISRIEKELQEITSVLSEWPELNEKLKIAKELKTEKDGRDVTDKWNSVRDTQAELTPEDSETAKLPYPELSELNLVKKAQREIATLENRLCGMNLNAAIRMFDGKTIEITSLRTGEKINVSDDSTSITEAVRIEIPDVMVMQLSPANVDVASVEEQISKNKATIAEIFAKYNVQTIEDLELYAQKIANAKVKIETINGKIAKILGDTSISKLEELYKLAGTVRRSKEEIDQDILTVCGKTEIVTFITKAETIIDGYATKYGSINDIKAKAFDLDTELKKAQTSVSSVDDIPDEYSGITDPDEHLKYLKEDLKFKQQLRESALSEKYAAASKLDEYKNANPDACQETVEKSERVFEETKSLLNHWLHIAEVFKKQKESIDNNPMQDIAENFARYLGIISDGKVSSEFPEADKLNMNIYSSDRLLDYGKLSEGTKETVSLAFRLAVLDHLFPNGGGVIVFDDPFTDMDADRTAQSCELIKECAKRHQVIFLTCREDYLSLLNGNNILF